MSALGRRKCRHECAGASFAYDPLQLRLRHKGKEQLIVDRRRWTQLAVGSVATAAILSEKNAEGHFLLRRHILISALRLAGKIASGDQANEQHQQSRSASNFSGETHGCAPPCFDPGRLTGVFGPLPTGGTGTF